MPKPPSPPPDTRYEPTPAPAPGPSRPRPRPRSGVNPPNPPPKRGAKRRRVASSDEEELSDRESDHEGQPPPNDNVNPIPTRRSQRSRRPAAGTYQEPDDEPMSDVDMGDGDNGDANPTPAPSQRPLFLEEEEDDSVAPTSKAEQLEDPPPTTFQSNTAADPFAIDSDEDTDTKKMQLNIRYEGFSITSWRLCLIVQPYPALPKRTSTSTTSSLLPPRQSSIVPFVRNGTEITNRRDATPRFREPTPVVRDRTPLFREPTPLFREPTPYERNINEDIMPPLDDSELERLYDDNEEPADDSLDSLKQFTQSFTQARSAVDVLGTTGDDADTDEDGFFMGDADERKD